MHQHWPRTALILFSRNAEAEAYAKPLLGKGRHRANAAIARDLTAHTLQALRRAGFEPHWFQEERQRGESFGERLANAFSDVFEHGYTSAIAVGNDCPDLSNLDWASVLRQLAEGQSVIGPDFRGGAYLIGLQARGFDPRAFASLPWQTSSLRAELQAHLDGNAPCTVLAAFRDLNSLQDLRSWTKAHRTALAGRLVALLQDPPAAINTPQRNAQQHIPTLAPLRGPPTRA